MSDKPVSATQFWIGTALTFFTIVVSIWSTRAEINAEAEANRRDKAAEQLGSLSSSISNVGSDLESHAGMFVDVEYCLKENQTTPKKCWQREYDFDPRGLADAWRDLGAKKASLKPYLRGDSEFDLLKSLDEIKVAHTRDLKPLLPPKSPEEARRVSDRISETKKRLEEKHAALEKAIADRVKEE